VLKAQQIKVTQPSLCLNKVVVLGYVTLAKILKF